VAVRADLRLRRAAFLWPWFAALVVLHLLRSTGPIGDWTYLVGIFGGRWWRRSARSWHRGASGWCLG